VDFLLKSQGREEKVQALPLSSGVQLQQGTQKHLVRFLSPVGALRTIELNGESFEIAGFRTEEGTYHLEIQGEFYEVELQEYYKEYFKKQEKKKSQNSTTLLKAPIPGRIVRIDVTLGQKVQAGQSLVVLSAMKMENVLSAPHAGIIQKIGVRLEETLAKNQFILEIAES
jgi:acetyl/propionyl-CoA carboxylase alpha subunit